MKTKIIAALLMLTGCGQVQTQSQLSRPAGEVYVGVGDIVFRIARAENLPNAFGRADVFGRTRERGFTEVRYLGIAPSGQVIFRRRDVDIATNETTMSRTMGFGLLSARGNSTGQFTATSTSFSPANAQVTALPPDTIDIALDLAQVRRVQVGEHGFDVLDATAGGVRVRVY